MKTRSSRRAALGALFSMASACSDPAGPVATSADAAAPVDLTTDFIPGDPTFRRDPALDVPNVSVRGEVRSHNAGENCLRCHQAKGPGRGQFVVAGTMYTASGEPLPNGTVRLYAKAVATDAGPPVLEDEVATLEVDGRGNFFTTEPLPGFPGRPLYPKLFGPDGEALLGPDGVRPAVMAGGVATGGCNFCHGRGMRIRGVVP